MGEIAIPGFIREPNLVLDGLMTKYGIAKRRAYQLRQKGMNRLQIIRTLSADLTLPARYVVTAHDSVEDLPPHVTFGGRGLQRLRERKLITCEEYRARRSSLLMCRGEKAKKGNLCLRIIGNQIRITVDRNKWIWLPVNIPTKYHPMIRKDQPYTVLIKRRNNRKGYDIHISVNIEEPIPQPTKRVMALDINSGHIDFAIAEKTNLKPITIGCINCHRIVDSNARERKIRVYRLAKKINRIAKHYQAEVVAGKLRTLNPGGRKANRRIQAMNQYEIRRALAYKLPLAGIPYTDLSEACTTKVGRKIMKTLGLDVHKASAYAFCIKVTDYESFMFLRGAPPYEGDGIPSRGLSGGSPQTVARQTAAFNGLTRNETRLHGLVEATPKQGKGGSNPIRFQTPILHVKV